jgi:DNA-binding NtrC family response regulator
VSRILVVDDQPNLLTSIRKTLAGDGHEVRTARSGPEALELVRAEVPDLVLMDVKLGEGCGLEALKEVKSIASSVPVILMTAYGTTETAIEAMKRGAFDFVPKPFTAAELKAHVESALAAGARAESAASEPLCSSPGEGIRMVGASAKMYEVCKRIGQVAPSNVTVLIRGESGTGKELVARAIHEHSLRAARPFVAVNCSAIPETLLESELFGHERGAFTGAAGRRLGKFEQAQGGTIFLDEVGDMTPATQSKVLRLLQDQTFERVGGSEAVRTDVRILAATNRPVEAYLVEGRFREDLYYRLRVVTIALPPLRERKEDIPALAEHFLRRCREELRSDRLRISRMAIEWLATHDWPGNVRELEHCVMKAAVLCKGTVILPEHLQLDATLVPRNARTIERNGEALRALARLHLDASAGSAFQRLMEQVERELLVEAFKETGGNLSRAADLLGISRPTLREKAVKYGLRGVPSAVGRNR